MNQVFPFYQMFPAADYEEKSIDVLECSDCGFNDLGYALGFDLNTVKADSIILTVKVPKEDLGALPTGAGNNFFSKLLLQKSC